MTLAATMASLTQAISFKEQEVPASGSYYQPPTPFNQDADDEIIALYYYYYGPSVAFIIFVDILIPVLIITGIVVTIVCVVRAVNRRRQFERT